MHIKLKKYHHFYSLIAILLAIYSCSPERELAKTYIDDIQQTEIMVLVPDFIFKTSLKQYEVEGAERMDDYALDSILLNRSLFLKHLSDSSFLEVFTKGYIEELEKLNYSVYKSGEMDSFLSVKNPDFIINIAQIELEEYVLPIRDEELVYEYLFYKEIDLNAVSISSWFELTRMNTDEDLDKEVLFASHYILDDFEGDFKFYPFTGEIKYAYKIDSLLINDIYGLAGFLGKKYAGYTNDYLMNTYVYKNLPDKIKPKYYFHYRRDKNAFIPVEDDRFILMDE